MPEDQRNQGMLTGNSGRTGPPLQSKVGERARDRVEPLIPAVFPRPVDPMAAPDSGKQHATTILIADDREPNRKLLRSMLEPGNYSLIEAPDGQAALLALQTITTPVVALLDWEMPGMEGIDVCRQARLRPDPPPMFLLLLTVRDHPRDIVSGLRAGANDYVTKPFMVDELLARVKIGLQMVELQQSLADRVAELLQALAQVRQLSGILPICSYCKKIRDDHDFWQRVEEYITDHSEAKFTHGICPECYSAHVTPELARPGLASP